jgi:hypothetical protein
VAALVVPARIVTSQGPAEPNGVRGVLEVKVDVLTPDGVRVVAVEANRPRVAGPAAAGASVDEL